jgi:predicted GNAT family acetyltransferase
MTVEIRDNPTALVYEAHVDGEPAGIIRYIRDGNTITMLHTEIEPKFEHHGIGSELVQRALEDVRAKGEKVRPLCPFVAAYLRRHPDYDDIVVD